MMLYCLLEMQMRGDSETAAAGQRHSLMGVESGVHWRRRRRTTVARTVSSLLLEMVAVAAGVQCMSPQRGVGRRSVRSQRSVMKRNTRQVFASWNYSARQTTTLQMSTL
jgi:hypothetical protein